MSRVTVGAVLFGDFQRAVGGPTREYGGWFSHDMRTFFRDKFSDQASIVDLVVIRGREQAELGGNRGVTISRVRLPVCSTGLVNTQNDFGASKAPAGLDLEIDQISRGSLFSSKSIVAFGGLVFHDQSSVGGKFGCFPYLHHPNYNAMPTVS